MARKEHGEFASNIDLIDTLPPGLYEAVFEPKTDSIPGADLVTGNWIMRSTIFVPSAPIALPMTAASRRQRACPR